MTSYLDPGKARKEARPVFCSEHAGSVQDGYLVCDDGKAVPCSVCGKVTRPIRDCRFTA